MSAEIMKLKPKTLLWSSIIAIAVVGIVALFDILLPSKQAEISEHGWGFYILLLIVVFAILMLNLCRIDQEKEGRVNNKFDFIKGIVFSAMFLLLAVDHYVEHENLRDWVFAIIFTAALPMEIRSAVQSYKSWKNSNQSDDKRD